ncbi:uncharacterized protein DSM5745_04400 [Aspergillus mulundensis]|uniref:Mid2 domain-containing protein n=1 Tax=Aspergillus mulundensis TaxID=1810919 RepID=A0A3D8SDA3_9EURO|nr:hypothetical protein DSM5745_04400 [Aspergillus mulundensis]RDW84074.1 hypothetical protein DSM5745_04400 [Aspergillus mulundensis]
MRAIASILIPLQIELLYAAIASATAAPKAQGQGIYETDSGDSSTLYTATNYATTTTEETTTASTIWLEHPQPTDTVNADSFILQWSYNFAYNSDFTVGLWSTVVVDRTDEIFSTTVHAPDRSITLPASALPSLAPDEITAVWLNLYMSDNGNGIAIGTDIPKLTIRGALPTPATLTSTVVGEGSVTTTRLDTTTENPEPTASDDGEGVYWTTGGGTDPSFYEDGDEGLSTGAKAGVGVGVAAGVVVLVAIGAFIFYRRRKRNEVATKTIREITASEPAVSAVFPANGSWSAGGETMGTVRPGSLPVTLSPLSGLDSTRGSGIELASARA